MKKELYKVMFEDHGDSFDIDVEKGEAMDQIIDNEDLGLELLETTTKNTVRCIQENHDEGMEDSVLNHQLLTKIILDEDGSFQLLVSVEGMGPFDEDFLKEHLSEEEYKEYTKSSDKAFGKIKDILGEYYQEVLGYVLEEA